MKILIISAFFPPQNSIASLRPYSWAKHWARDGHEVTVLTTCKIPAPSDSPMPCENFTVLEVPIPSMAWISRFLSGKGRADAAISTTIQPTTLSLRQRLGQWVGWLQLRYGIAYGCRMPDPLDLWSGVALKAVERQRWDLVVSTAGPYGVHAPAYALRRQGRASRWIADWRDLWVDSQIFPGLPGFRVIERWLEKRWCLCADVVTTVSQPLADVLRAKYGDKVHVIYNGFDPEDYAQLATEPAFALDGVLRIVYTGTIYAGKQDPKPLFRALAELSASGAIGPDKVQVLFCGHNANVNDLAQREDVSGYVQYLGFVPRAKALQMQRDASALLLLEVESETAKGILTGKLFEYLFAGPPIWTVGTGGDSSVADILKETARGEALGTDVELIKKKILEIMIRKNNSDGSTVINPDKLLHYARSELAQQMLRL